LYCHVLADADAGGIVTGDQGAVDQDTDAGGSGIEAGSTG